MNSETRKLIKRSSRAGDLKKKFKIEEMSSISTLEVAWENRVGLWKDETLFCVGVACTNKLELLKWAREEKKCKWDRYTIIAAAQEGNLEMVKYCVAKKCPINETACSGAAWKGHLEVLKYLHEEAKAPWAHDTANCAAFNGDLHILEYLVERKYDKFEVFACERAAGNGHLDCLKYLRETAKAPWDADAVRKAHENNHPNVYNTSSTTTVRYHLVGDTNMESYTRFKIIGIIHQQKRIRGASSVFERAKYAENAERQYIHRDMVLETAQN